MPKKVKWDEKQCKMQLRMAVTRIKLLRSKSQEINKQAKKAVANLLAEGNERRARVRVYNVINEDYLYEAYNMVELYCETVAARIELLSCTRQCPPDLMPAVCAVLYAAPKMSVAELVQARELIIAKYGPQLQCACVDQQCVNEKNQLVGSAWICADGTAQLVLRLRNQRPSDALVNYYLSAIAKKHNVDWSLGDDVLDPIEAPEVLWKRDATV